MDITNNPYVTKLALFLGVALLSYIPLICMVDSMIIGISLSVLCGLFVTILDYKLFPDEESKTTSHPPDNKEKVTEIKVPMIDPKTLGYFLGVLFLLATFYSIDTISTGTYDMRIVIFLAGSMTLTILIGFWDVTIRRHTKPENNNGLG